MFDSTMRVGDMVRVNGETLGASAITGKNLSGKVGIVLL